MTQSLARFRRSGSLAGPSTAARTSPRFRTSSAMKRGRHVYVSASNTRTGQATSCSRRLSCPGVASGLYISRSGWLRVSGMAAASIWREPELQTMALMPSQLRPVAPEQRDDPRCEPRQHQEELTDYTQYSLCYANLMRFLERILVSIDVSCCIGQKDSAGLRNANIAQASCSPWVRGVHGPLTKSAAKNDLNMV